MSRTYVVKLGTVSSESRERQAVLCPRIVPEMPALLGDALAGAGWDVADGRARKRFGDAEVEIDLENAALELKARAEVEVVGRGYDHDDDQARGEAEARRDAEARKGEFEQAAMERADRALIAVEDTVRREVAGAVKGALLEALQRKAAQLGEVRGVEHSTDADGRPVTTITVEV